MEVEVAEAPVPGKQAEGCRFGPDVGGVEVRYRISGLVGYFTLKKKPLYRL